jgi:hypothetical protein
VAKSECSKNAAKGPPRRWRSERVRTTSAARWRTLGAALAELGWPWLRLHAELLSGRLAYRTHPPDHAIDWNNRNLHVDRAESTVTMLKALPPGAVGFSNTTIAVEVLLPIGRRPPVAAIKASWRDRVRPSEADLKNAMEEIAKSCEGKPLPIFDDVWSALKARWPGFPRDDARDVLASYAPQLKRAPGKTKSRS